MAAKLERIPFAHNWARYIHPSLDETVEALVGFARNVPRITYVDGQKIIYDRIVLKTDPMTAIRASQRGVHKKSRPHVESYVRAFLKWDQHIQLVGLPSITEEVQPFRLSRGLFVPVKPLVISAKGGKLQPFFSVGWATLPFSEFQYRLLMTVFEDALFSLEDYDDAEGLFAVFPKDGRKPDAARKPIVWKRGDFDLFSATQLRDIVEMYLDALVVAKEIIANDPAPDPAAPREPETDPRQLPLF